MLSIRRWNGEEENVKFLYFFNDGVTSLFHCRHYDWYICKWFAHYRICKYSSTCAITVITFSKEVPSNLHTATFLSTYYTYIVCKPNIIGCYFNENTVLDTKTMKIYNYNKSCHCLQAGKRWLYVNLMELLLKM